MAYNKQIKFLTINSKAKWKRDLLLYCSITEKERFIPIDNNDDGNTSSFDISDDGLTLKSYLAFQKSANNIKSGFLLDKDDNFTMIDLTSDHCGVLYAVTKNDDVKDIPQNEASEDSSYSSVKYKIQTLNTRSYFIKETQKNFDNPTRIEVGLQYIYVLDDGNIQILSKRNHQTKSRISLHMCNNPFDIAIDDKDNLYILDENSIIYRLEPESKKVTPIFSQKLQDSTTVQNIPIDKIAIGKKDNRIYAFSIRGHTILKVSKNGLVEKSTTLTKPSLISDSTNHHLFVYDGDNCFLSGVAINPGDSNPLKILKIDSNGDATPILDAKEGQISMNKNGALYYISKTENNLLQYVPVFRSTKYTSFITKRFDSTKYDTQWHKIVLDSKIPENTIIEVSCYATNNDIQITEKHMPNTLPTNESSNNTNDDFVWSKSIINPKDTLIDAKGRYLWLKVILRSIDESNTPTLSVVTVFFPRISYLRYLPAIYSEDKTSRNFLERFLSLFETISDDIDTKISNLSRLFDPKTTPADFLPWLSSWLAFGFDDRWSIRKTRLLLQMLPELYKMRGTREGLEKMVSIYLDDDSSSLNNRFSNFGSKYSNTFLSNEQCIIANDNFHHENSRQISSHSHDRSQNIHKKERQFLFTIIENFQITCAKKDNNLLHEYKCLFGSNPYYFYVLLNSLHISQEMTNVIKTIVDSEKPAHTVGQVIALNPWFVLGEHLYLGVNTYLNKRDLVLGRAILGRDSIISKQ